MTLFGVGSDAGNHADHAVEAGCSMQEKLKHLNVDRARRGEEALGIGIGINTGPAIVGSIGSPDRMEFTVIGNTVNVASRIEQLTKTMGASLLMSRTTRDALQRAPELRELPPQQVKGVAELVQIFGLVN